MGSMPGPLIATKFHVPASPPDWVPRPQLLAPLDSAMQRPCKLILLSAPAGFGKTTLVAQWLRQREIPAAWLSLDRDDNDPARFWRYVVAALQTADDRLGLSIGLSLEAPQLPPLEGLIAALANDLSLVEGPLVLVLDDYHWIEESDIHAGLSRLLDTLPPKIRILLATRADPPLGLARLRGNDQLAETRTTDLRFTRDEAAAFLNNVHQLNLTDQDVEFLERRTEGWIVGLQLAALSLRRQPDRHAFVTAFAGDDRYVMDYLLEEVLQQQTPAVHSFLLQTAILERLCGPLCEAVTGMADAAAMLHQLEEANLFLLPLDNRRYWYRYHTLFADLLRRRLRQGRTEAERLSLYRRASLWLEREGFLAEAVSQAFAAPDFELAADLLERHVLSIFFRSETMLAHTWLKTLPEAVLENRPLLCAMYTNTIAHSGGFGPAALRSADGWLKKAEQALADRESDGAEPDPQEAAYRRLARSLIGLSRAYLALWRGDPPATVVALAQRALEDLPAEDDPATDSNFLRMRSGLNNNLAISYLALGDEAAATPALAEARRVGQACGDLLNAYAAVGMQCDILRRKGRLPEACTLCQEELKNLGGGDSIPYAGLVQIYIGQIQLEWNDLEAADSALTRGVALSRLTATPNILAIGSLALADLQQARGDFTDALSTLRQSEESAPNVKTWIESHRIRLLLRQGRSDEAALWAQGRLLEREGQEEALTLARVILALHRAPLRNPPDSLPGMEALRQFMEREIQATSDTGWIDRRIELLVLESLYWHVQNDPGRAASSLLGALALAQPGGYIRRFVDEGEPIFLLLKGIAGKTGELDPYIGRLLSAQTASGETRLHSSAAQQLVEPLSAREVEVLRLLAAGDTNAEIAQKLVITLNTTKKHITHIFGKLDVANRAEAIARAKELELLVDWPIRNKS
jgi:LuxR family transcriptional regulator, maltose regulon positive regulatory protein